MGRIRADLHESVRAGARLGWLGLALVTAGLAACTQTSVELEPTETPPAAVALSVLHASQLFNAGSSALVTGWEHEPAKLDAQVCQGCHGQAHAEWSRSMHALAWTAPLFQKAYVEEPLTWCRNCHAPLLVQEQGTLPREQGVNCAACHVRRGEILGARDLARTATRHAVQRVEQFSAPVLCAGCHQFNFPQRTLEEQPSLGQAVHYGDQVMQGTFVEWQASGAAHCSTCHGVGHVWSGPNNVAWLRKQFGPATLHASDEGVLSLSVRLSPRGHALPTGDPFRSLLLEVALDPHFERPLVRQRYGRQFDGVLSSGFTLIQGGQSRDTRVPANQAALSVTFDRPHAARLFARLRFFFHDRWVAGKWTADSAGAVSVWSAEFKLGAEKW